METVMARGEAGARFQTNVIARDLDLGAFGRIQPPGWLKTHRRWPLPLARSTTRCPSKPVGHPKHDAARRNGVATKAARKTTPQSGSTHSWQVVEVTRGGPEVGGRLSPRQPTFFAVSCLSRFGVCLRV